MKTAWSRKNWLKLVKKDPLPPDWWPSGLTQKPLYMIGVVCALFRVSRQTIYEWTRLGKLKLFKVRFRVYFLASDVQGLLDPNWGRIRRRSCLMLGWLVELALLKVERNLESIFRLLPGWVHSAHYRVIPIHGKEKTVGPPRC